MDAVRDNEGCAVDLERVYVAGLSAGAGMAVILGATYEDVFAAIGVASGLEYKASPRGDLPGLDPLVMAQLAMSLGGPDPDKLGTAAAAAMGPLVQVVPAIVFHGTADPTVRSVNADQVVRQWAQINDLLSDKIDNDNVDDRPEEVIAGQVPNGRPFKHEIYRDADTGEAVIERYMVLGMGHAWSGGSPEGTFTDPAGPDASSLMWDFFAKHPRKRRQRPPSRLGARTLRDLVESIRTSLASQLPT